MARKPRGAEGLEWLSNALVLRSAKGEVYVFERDAFESARVKSFERKPGNILLDDLFGSKAKQVREFKAISLGMTIKSDIG